MNQRKHRKRLEGFLSLIDEFPSVTPQGRRQDERYRERLQAELDALDIGTNSLTIFRQSAAVQRAKKGVDALQPDLESQNEQGTTFWVRLPRINSNNKGNHDKSIRNTSD